MDIETRIIVAGGGGGGGACGQADVNFGGHAGGIEGGAARRSGTDKYCIKAVSQGGNKDYGVKWEGADEVAKKWDEKCGVEGNGGGGGGYYGGQTTKASGEGSNSGGGGGSSCISGDSRCFTYNGYIFTDINMKGGGEQFKSPTGTLETGHSGNGYARISKYPIVPTSPPKSAKAISKFFSLLIMIK